MPVQAMHDIKTKFKKATSTGKGKIILLLIFILISSVIAGGIHYWNTYKKQIIRGKLEDTVREKTSGLYLLRYDTLKLDEVAGDLLITNIRLVYDSVKYHALQKTNDAPAILIKLNIESLEVSGVKTPRALIDKEIVGKKIHIRNPSIQILYTNEGRDSSRVVPDKDVYEQILGHLNMIKVDTVEISGAEIVTRTLKTGKENVQLKNTFIRLIDVAVDSAASKDKSRLAFARQIFLSAERISWKAENGLYTYVSDSIEINTAEKSAYAKNFLIKPTLSENAFVKSLPTQDDRFDFSFNSIAIYDLNMPDLFNEQITADSVHIKSASLKIYRDISIPRDKKNRVGLYPHQALGKIPVPIKIKKIILPNTFVEYKEKNPRSNQAGKVQFYNTHATLTNVTNDKEAIRENNTLTAEITTRFLNKTSLNVVWQFYLMHPKGRFDVKGNLGPMRFADANVVTEPMGPAKLEEGRLNNLHFKLEGNDYDTHGTVKMLYEDLKVAVLEKEKGSKKLDKKTVASIAANIIIKNSNPVNDKDDPKIVTVQMERNTNRSIFYLVWKSLLKGIKETSGIKN